MKIQSEYENIESYRLRNDSRELTLNTATMNFVQYFVDLGDDLSVAQNKVSQVSTETAQYIYVYILGNTTPLINAINNSTLPFMDNDAKNKLTNDLST